MDRCHNIPKTVLRNVLTVTWRPSPIQVCMATVIPFHSCLMFSISRAYHLDPQIAELRQKVPSKELTKDLVVNLISNPRSMNAYV